jgi:hypothetical protein
VALLKKSGLYPWKFSHLAAKVNETFPPRRKDIKNATEQMIITLLPRVEKTDSFSNLVRFLASWPV